MIAECARTQLRLHDLDVLGKLLVDLVVEQVNLDLPLKSRADVVSEPFLAEELVNLVLYRLTSHHVLLLDDLGHLVLLVCQAIRAGSLQDPTLSDAKLSQDELLGLEVKVVVVKMDTGQGLGLCGADCPDDWLDGVSQAHAREVQVEQ